MGVFLKKLPEVPILFRLIGDNSSQVQMKEVIRRVLVDVVLNLPILLRIYVAYPEHIGEKRICC